MSARAIPARAMGDFIGGDPPQPPRPDYEYDECECGERKRAEANLCRACWNRYQRAMHHEANVPEMLERHRRFEFALEVGYTVHELMALCRRDALPTYEELARERPREYMRVWCARQGIVAGEREAA